MRFATFFCQCPRFLRSSPGFALWFGRVIPRVAARSVDNSPSGRRIDPESILFFRRGPESPPNLRLALTRAARSIRPLYACARVHVYVLARLPGFPPLTFVQMPRPLDRLAGISPYLGNALGNLMMFSKTADPTSSPLPPVGGSNASRSVLGTDLKITGEITSSGTIEVLGEVDGNITAATLTVGSSGRVSGSVTANTIEVVGRLDGKVDSGSFTMRAASQVAADVSYSSLVIESGAQIEGRFARPKG